MELSQLKMGGVKSILAQIRPFAIEVESNCNLQGTPTDVKIIEFVLKSDSSEYPLRFWVRRS